ncbi:MAG: hypothetical protein HQL67_12465 [Magnetococcales bacterium]|nr:hypothetical protein [Magnetococcales bacterium]
MQTISNSSTRTSAATPSRQERMLDSAIYFLTQSNRHLKKARFHSSRHITDADTRNRVRLASDHLENAMTALAVALAGREVNGVRVDPCPVPKKKALSGLSGLLALDDTRQRAA